MRERNNTDDWTTVELAEAAHVEPSRIRQLLIEGEDLTGYHLGRDWRVPDSVARGWLNGRGIVVENP